MTPSTAVTGSTRTHMVEEASLSRAQAAFPFISRAEGGIIAVAPRTIHPHWVPIPSAPHSHRTPNIKLHSCMRVCVYMHHTLHSIARLCVCVCVRACVCCVCVRAYLVSEGSELIKQSCQTLLLRTRLSVT